MHTIKNFLLLSALGCASVFGQQILGGGGGSGGSPTGAAGGSLGGTYPNPSIATSVALPGNPTTTTQAANDSSTKVATTAYADRAASNTMSTCTGLLSVTTVTFTMASPMAACTYTLTANVSAVVIAGVSSGYNELHIFWTQGASNYIVASPSGFNNWIQPNFANASISETSYVTKDGGTSWQAINSSNQTFSEGSVSAQPANNQPATSVRCWLDSTDLENECVNSSGVVFKQLRSGVDVNPVTGQVTATHLSAALPVNQGGTGTISTLTGLLRGNSSAMTAAEISGDCTTSGSNAITCTRLNGTTFAGANGDLAGFGAANTPADTGFLATNVVRKDTTNSGAAAMTLDMSASTTSNAFKAPVKAGVTTAVNGAIGYDSTTDMIHAAQASADAMIPQFTATPANGDCAKWTVSGSKYKLDTQGAACGSGGSAAGASLFSTTNSTTVTATSATTLIGTITGSQTVPVNTFTAGQVLMLHASGYYSTPATPVSLTIDFKVGGTTRISTGAVVQIASVTNGVWNLDCVMTTRTAGAGGTQIANCIFVGTGSTLTPGEAPMFVSSTWSVDTTATQVIDLQATWSTATGSPTITSTNIAAWIPGAPVSSVNTKTGAVALTLNSSDFANEGTTTTVLHGNGAGNPSFAQVAIGSDVSGLGTGVATFLGTPSGANFNSMIAAGGIPINCSGTCAKSAAYTTVLGDGGGMIIHASSDNNARTFTIDSNANVAYPLYTVITFVNSINTVTIAITSDTMTLAGTASTGNRTLAVNGVATAVKVGATSWLISGPGLT